MRARRLAFVAPACLLPLLAGCSSADASAPVDGGGDAGLDADPPRDDGGRDARPDADADVTTDSRPAADTRGDAADVASDSPATSGLAAMPIISRHVPVFASPGASSPPSNANDDDYGTDYRSGGVPAWLAYDLSAVPVAHRGKVLVVHYNGSYAYNTLHGPHYNNLGDYTIETNAAPGGGGAPSSGWTTQLTVSGNTLHSRQHVLDLAGAPWVRIQVTASDGSALNTDASFNQLDVYDLGALGVPTDDWIFYGDSITAGGMVTFPEAGTEPFAVLIHAKDGARWPVAECGGEPFDRVADGLRHLLGAFDPAKGTGYLSIFPGRFVALSYGMNDAGATDPATYASAMETLVTAVLGAGKVPLIPKISFTNEAAHNAAIPALNAKLDELYAKYPAIVRGPDFWTYFQTHPTEVGAGDIHPTAAGYAAMRRLWADAMISVK